MEILHCLDVEIAIVTMELMYALIASALKFTSLILGHSPCYLDLFLELLMHKILLVCLVLTQTGLLSNFH
jgi:hypothetical protein